MTILLADPRVRAVPVIESGEPLVRLGTDLSPAGAVVRVGLAARLVRADAALPAGLRLRVVEGHRSATAQQAIIETYAAQLCACTPASARPTSSGSPAASSRRSTSPRTSPAPRST
ncbi:hypothetical protein [Nocardioides deserti]|uniref:hypothetical protein n=1 Tax=Nocardioides deserti TaxID=1588644 RepID=UPI0019CCE6DD|nr:hypothetical protein [Nocardioides deserti]GGO75916.1 hypothetical protein GCM10012276_27420 [Nocardioides deserti]